MARLELARVGELVMPEGIVLGAVATGHIVFRSLDMAFNLQKPFRRVSDWGHLIVEGGSAFLYAKRIQPEIARTVFIGNSMLLVTSLADLVFQRTAAPKLRAIGKAKARQEIAKGAAGDTGKEAAAAIAAAEEVFLLGDREVEVLPGDGVPLYVDEEIAA